MVRPPHPLSLASGAIRAHLRRLVGGGPDGPLRDLAQVGARAKPALGVDHPPACAEAPPRARLSGAAWRLGPSRRSGPLSPRAPGAARVLWHGRSVAAAGCRL